MKWGWFGWAEKQNDWHAAVCPSLRVFDLHYQRWVRPSKQCGFVAPLLALGWTRKKIAKPLQTSCVHIQVNKSNWKRVDLVPVEPQCLIELDIPQLEYIRLNKGGLKFVIQAYLTSTTLSIIGEPDFSIADYIPYLTEAVFGTSFDRIRVLVIQGYRGSPTLNVLHCFHHLEDLSLLFVGSSLYPRDVDLPLLQTLQRLRIRGGCAKWLDDHTFVQLTSFSIGGTLRDLFLNRVYMPVCAHISLCGLSLELLPVFQAALVPRLMAEWNLQGLEPHQGHFHAADGATHPTVGALNKIHARVLRLTTATGYKHLITVIQLRYELEDLSIQFKTDIRVANEFLIALTKTIVDYSLTKVPKPSFDT